jgi:hypothetical protein
MRAIPLLVLGGCLAVPRYPGPLGPLGRAVDLPVEHPAPDDLLVPSPEDPAPTEHPDAVARAARYFLTHTPAGFRDDCSGFVCATYDRVGIPLSGGTAALWSAAENAGAVHHRKIPSVGDLAFFDDTWDKNGNGKLDDPLTHVALVLVVGADGTLTMAHGGSSHGRTTFTMNLREPHARRAPDGTELNDYLRVQRRSDPPGTKYLASELLRGFATVRERDLDKWVAPNG